MQTTGLAAENRPVWMTLAVTTDEEHVMMLQANAERSGSPPG